MKRLDITPAPYVLLLLTLLTVYSCSTSRHVTQLVERTSVDTVYLSNVQYDSIYVSQDKYIDRSRDTLLIKDKTVEYRYRLLRDTVYKTRIDSIPFIHEVEVIREVPRDRNWIDYLCYTITVIISGLLLIRVLSYVLFFKKIPL